MKRRSAVRELLETAVLTIAIFLVVRVALQNFKVEGDSMFPNLHNGEYILVNKIDYMLHSPGRGDIIVFFKPGEPDLFLVKRTIGLPGDRIHLRNGVVYLNGVAQNEPQAGMPLSDGDPQHAFDSYRDDFPAIYRDLVQPADIMGLMLPDLTDLIRSRNEPCFRNLVEKPA